MAPKEEKFRDMSSDLEDCESDDQSLLDHGLNQKTVRSPRKRHWAFLAVNAFVLLLNVGILLMISSPKGVDEGADMKTIQYPRFPQHEDWIKDAIDFELQVYDDQFGNHGEFRGVPSPELDAAWGSMYLENFTIRIPGEGFREPTPGSILTKYEDEEGGVMGTFAFIHNLHCLKYIRQYMLPEYYPETAAMYKPTPGSPIPVHIDHCIDILRQSELCRADMALYTFEWRENEPNPVNIHHTPHICANRPKLTKFLEEVQVLPFGQFRNPFTGKRPLWDPTED